MRPIRPATSFWACRVVVPCLLGSSVWLWMEQLIFSAHSFVWKYPLCYTLYIQQDKQFFTCFHPCRFLLFNSSPSSLVSDKLKSADMTRLITTSPLIIPRLTTRTMFLYLLCGRRPFEFGERSLFYTTCLYLVYWELTFTSCVFHRFNELVSTFDSSFSLQLWSFILICKKHVWNQRTMIIQEFRGTNPRHGAANSQSLWHCFSLRFWTTSQIRWKINYMVY